MIIIFGQDLVYLTGMLAGTFFTLGFVGCRFLFWLGKQFKFLEGLSKFAIKYHKTFMYLAFSFFLLHATLAFLRKFFNIWI